MKLDVLSDALSNESTMAKHQKEDYENKISQLNNEISKYQYSLQQSKLEVFLPPKCILLRYLCS